MGFPKSVVLTPSMKTAEKRQRCFPQTATGIRRWRHPVSARVGSSHSGQLFIPGRPQAPDGWRLWERPSRTSNGRRNRWPLRYRFDWKRVAFDLATVDECYHYFHSGQPMLACKINGALRVTKIVGFTKVSRPVSGATKIE